MQGIKPNLRKGTPEYQRSRLFSPHDGGFYMALITTELRFYFIHPLY